MHRKTVRFLRAALKCIGGAHLQVNRAVCDDHGDAYHARQQPKRVQQAKESAVVGEAQIHIDAQRHALQQVPKCDAEHQRRDEAADENAPVPHIAPAAVFQLGAIIKANRRKNRAASTRIIAK